MNEKQANRLFEKYNPKAAIKRCPNGRRKMRKPLDLYAKAAVNLYGIIDCDELAEIFNEQNEDKTTGDEIRLLLLPNVLKDRWYGFYKNYVVHYWILDDFDWVPYLETEQSGKPRYLPEKDQLLIFENESQKESKGWRKILDFMFKVFGRDHDTLRGYEELKAYILANDGIHGLGPILEKYDLGFDNDQQVQELLNLLMQAKNDTRIWENKGHTPEEMLKQRPEPSKNILEEEPEVRTIEKTGRNEPCPCGSGKKYKKCCGAIGEAESAQLNWDDRKLFYETWYQLLGYINETYHIVDYTFDYDYSRDKNDALLHRISVYLWEHPSCIRDFVKTAKSLDPIQVELLNSWEKHHITGQFTVVKYEPEYAVLLRTEKEGTEEVNTLYGVKGMTSSMGEILNQKLPILIETTIIPFKDTIIYHGFMGSYPINLGPGVRELITKTYNEAMAREGVLTQLT